MPEKVPYYVEETPFEKKMAGRKAHRERTEKKKPERSKYSPYFKSTPDPEVQMKDGELQYITEPLTWEELPYRETVMDDMGNTIPNPEAHPGLMGLTPFSPSDFALESLFTGAALSEDPGLAMLSSLALTRYGKKAAKFADVEGGQLFGKQYWKEGMKRAKSDPMLKDIPF